MKSGAFCAPSGARSTALETLFSHDSHIPKIIFLGVAESPCRDVPITASGPQVSNTLLSMNNAGKGIRQNRPVTLGKGLALVVRVGEGFCGEVFWT